MQNEHNGILAIQEKYRPMHSNEAEELEDHVLLAVHEPMLRPDATSMKIIQYCVMKTCSSVTSYGARDPTDWPLGDGEITLVRWLDCRFNMYLAENNKNGNGKLSGYPKTPVYGRCFYAPKKFDGGIFRQRTHAR